MYILKWYLPDLLLQGKETVKESMLQIQITKIKQWKYTRRATKHMFTRRKGMEQYDANTDQIFTDFENFNHTFIDKWKQQTTLKNKEKNYETILKLVTKQQY